MRGAMAKQGSGTSARACAFERWRLELFFKKPSELKDVTTLLRKHNVTRLNITNKVCSVKADEVAFNAAASRDHRERLAVSEGCAGSITAPGRIRVKLIAHI